MTGTGPDRQFLHHQGYFRLAIAFIFANDKVNTFAALEFLRRWPNQYQLEHNIEPDNDRSRSNAIKEDRHREGGKGTVVTKLRSNRADNRSENCGQGSGDDDDDDDDGDGSGGPRYTCEGPSRGYHAARRVDTRLLLSPYGVLFKVHEAFQGGENAARLIVARSGISSSQDVEELRKNRLRSDDRHL
jgi:hypothetical protein